MQGSRDFLWNKPFSHVYVERGAYAYPLTERILRKLSGAVVVPIAHYKDIFCRRGQDYDAQKHSPALLLGVKQGPFVLDGSPLCDNHGYAHFFYVTQVMNCLYNCAYCYLRGMYASAHVTVFVNTGDYFNAVDEKLAECVDANGLPAPVYVSASYDTDLLAMERLFGFAEQWVEYAARKPSLTLEIRTKSAEVTFWEQCPPAPNVLFSWTVSPEETADSYEKGAPPPEKRLDAVNAALKAGWRVRLCIDPVLLTDGWMDNLRHLMHIITQRVDINKLDGIESGGFRVSKTYFKRMRKISPSSVIFSLPLTERDGVLRYSEADEAKIKEITEGFIR